MSKRKRDVAYIKPEEPAFLARMKAQAGYKEGPTVDTKREALSIDEDSDSFDDEEPQIVVVKEGDLTAEEASKIKLEKQEGPADLTQRVVFKKPVKTKDESDNCEVEPNVAKKSKQEAKKDISKINTKPTEKKKSSNSRALLSFDDEDETEES